MKMIMERIPLMKMRVRIPPGYPGDDPPGVEIKGFYARYKEQIEKTLVDRWSPGSLVLYDWYTYLLSDFLDELVLPLDKEPIS